MAALAEILYDQGKEVQGSDIEKYIFTEDGLRDRNIPIYPFDPENIHDNDTVIVGLSFGKDHPEVAAALANPSVKVYWYNEYLGHLLEDYTSICVAGCHGKSTTTGILASVLSLGDSTGFLIGDGHGHMPEDAKTLFLSPANSSGIFWLIILIMQSSPILSLTTWIITKISMTTFQPLRSLPARSKGAVIFGDDPYLKDLDYPCPIITYGLEEGNDYRAINFVQGHDGMEYDVEHDGKILVHVTLDEVGYPFLWDSLGAFAMASLLGMKPEAIVEGLQAYKGINRRFVIEEIGENVLIDDYAHHPTAIHNMIAAAKAKYPDKKVIALYKPDRYSRLQYFLDGFAKSLNEADQAIVLDFPANARPEDETITVTIDDLLNKLNDGMLLDISEESAKKLEEMGPAVYLFMSSKDIYLLRDKLKNNLSN